MFNVALMLGRRHGYNIDANQEFLALGQLFHYIMLLFKSQLV